MNESCLCKCFTELYFFHWLFVVFHAILILVPFVFSPSVSIACRSTQNAGRIKRFLRLHSVIKPLNRKKINITNALFCWSVTLLINVYSNTLPQLALKIGACQKWEPAGCIGNFGNVLNGFAKSPRLIVLNIDWVQFVLKNCEILHSVRGLYDK